MQKAPKSFSGGLSPRGRGKLRQVGRTMRGAWSIPAWAGETQCGALWRRHARRPWRSIPAWAGETKKFVMLLETERVYPRVGGGNIGSPGCPYEAGGLSPRGRGKRLCRRMRFSPNRSIPAWAGETILTPDSPMTGAVYPRVGGGNPQIYRRCECVGGLSPRGRGKPGADECAYPCRRSIPAWAGETQSARP